MSIAEARKALAKMRGGGGKWKEGVLGRGFRVWGFGFASERGAVVEDRVGRFTAEGAEDADAPPAFSADPRPRTPDTEWRPLSPEYRTDGSVRVD